MSTNRKDMHEVEFETGRKHLVDYFVNCDGEIAGGTAKLIHHGKRFSFVVFGDPRSRPRRHRRMVERLLTEPMDFLLGTGDLVDESRRESEWQKFFDIEKELLARHIFFPTVGNHDRVGRSAKHFQRYFSLNDETASPERYYRYDVGNSAFLVLDSNLRPSEHAVETKWLLEQLRAIRADSSIRHVFVAMHHPLYSVSLHGGHKRLRRQWGPIFTRFAVDAVFAGHDHAYMRAQVDGVRYFVSGGGGAPLYGKRRNISTVDRGAVKHFARINHYLRVSVNGPKVRVAAHDMHGELIESVSWEVPMEPSPRDVAPRALLSVGAPLPVVEEETRRSGRDANGWPLFTFIGSLTGLGLVARLLMMR